MHSEFLDDSGDTSLLVCISVVLTYQFTGVTPSATSLMYRHSFDLLVHPYTPRFQQRLGHPAHEERSMSEYYVDDSNETLMVDGVH